jgi:sugar (pentulose or hexulose) kinase
MATPASWLRTRECQLLGNTVSKSFLLGIDAGTSVIKAALIDRDGHEQATTAYPTVIRSPQPDHSEANPAEFWELTAAAIREVLAKASINSEEVAGIGLSGNMVGVWLIDAQGEPVRDAILWNDGRTQALIARLSAEHPGFMSQIFASSGSVMQQGCTLPVVRWLAEYEPESLARAAYVLCCKDWLRFKLTGTIYTDVTEASVMPGDIRGRNYNEVMFDLLGIRAYRHLFPPVATSESISGHIHAEAATHTGLKMGTPVVIGAGDVPASTIGAGAIETGVASIILGTTCLSCLTVAAPSFEPSDVGLLFVLPGGNWLRVMANVAGTTNLDWFISQFFAAEQAASASTVDLFQKLEAIVEQSPPGANGVIYLPYLSPIGVIAPFVQAGARAQFCGLLPHHTRGDLLRAVYEGVALAIRDCYIVMETPISEVRLSGGGAKSRMWGQMIADVLSVRVIVPEGAEFGAKGAALLAGVGLDWYDSVQEASLSTSRSLRAYEPDRQLKSVYNTVYQTYRSTREALSAMWSGDVVNPHHPEE